MISRASVIFSALVACSLAHASDSTQVSLEYAQTGGALSTVSSIQDAKGDLTRINDILQSKFGSFEAAVGVIKARYETPRYYFEASSEVLGIGQVQNPVLPQLHAGVTAEGVLSGGLHSDSGEWTTRAGLTAGYGREGRVDAISTDFLDHVPWRWGGLALGGGEAELGRRVFPCAGCRWMSTILARETFFGSSVQSSTQSLSSPSSVFHWKAKTGFDKTLSGGNRFSLGAEAIAGPTPLPTDFLPRAYEYEVDAKPFPSFGSMVGAGAVARKAWGSTTLLVGRAGFYGGYVGGEASFHSGRFEGGVGSWALNPTPFYQLVSQRLWMGRFQILL
jgi:hypothetical protein